MIPLQHELLCNLRLEPMIVRAVELLRENVPPEGYYGCFSGGKDSCVIKELARLAGVPVVWHYNVTTVDPPELVQFIVDHHPDVKRLHPGTRMFDEAAKRGLPTRTKRWCCEKFKESRSPKGATMLMGMRAAESPRRAAMWSEVVYHERTKCNAVLPVFAWSDAHVWECIKAQALPYCCLYDEGFSRLGCVGCPMATARLRLHQFARWPSIESQWKDACARLWHAKQDRIGCEYLSRFPSPESLWNWWVMDEFCPPKQCGEMKLFEPEDEHGGA